MANITFWVSAGATVTMAMLLLSSIVMTAKPTGSQNQALFGIVITTSVIASLLGWFIGYILFNGNPTAQLHFLLFFTFLLFMVTMVSATTSAFQLYGLREAMAAKT
jgi:uncharacterized membrane protein